MAAFFFKPYLVRIFRVSVSSFGEVCSAVFPWMLLIPGTGNGERGTGNRERESGNKCTADTLLRVQNGGQNKRKGSKRNNLG